MTEFAISEMTTKLFENVDCPQQQQQGSSIAVYDDCNCISCRLAFNLWRFCIQLSPRYAG